MNDLVKIVVPIYNGANYLHAFIVGIPDRFRNQFIMIDDGSSDGTGAMIQDAGINVIRHVKNRGKGAALRVGAKEAIDAGARYIITMDVDLQHPLAELDKFMDIHDENEVRLGYRWNRKKMPVMRRLSNFITSLLVSVRTNTVIKDSQCGFRAIPLVLFTRFHYQENGFPFESELLLRAGLSGFTMNHIRIPTIYDRQSSAISPLRDTLQFMIIWFRSYFWV